MIPLQITINIDHGDPWPQVKELAKITRIGRLPKGTCSGKSTVSIQMVDSNGDIMIGETTMALFLNAAKVLKIADEENQ